MFFDDKFAIMKSRREFMKAKKNYRDSLFRNIFKDKNRLRSLYQALTGKDVSIKEIHINTLKGVFFNDIKNDISFRIGNRMVILMEHQSTWNPNMPLRMLWYIAKIYNRELKKDMPYRASLIKIPMPEFYVLYNGSKQEPYHSVLHLSDAFAEKKDSESSLELAVDTYNINYTENNQLLKRCEELKAYSIFVAQVKMGLQDNLRLSEAIKQAIRYCEAHDLLADYFSANEQEVFDMVTFKWDDKRALEIAREEGDQHARYEMALDMLKAKTPVDYIVKISKLSLKQVQELAKEHHLVIA